MGAVAAWVAAGAAVAAVLITLLGGLGVLIFNAGIHTRRITTLEENHKDLSETVTKVKEDAAAANAAQAGLSATVAGIKSAMEAGFADIKQTVRDALAEMRAAPASRPRRREADQG